MRLSVVVPAYNEESTIRAILERVLAVEVVDQIVVVNDRSTDSTGAILARLASEDSRLAVIDNEEPPAGWLGKPWALHQASLGQRPRKNSHGGPKR